jgi:hypothetical protein
MFTKSSTNDLVILPDTGFPNNWKQSTYYSFLKETAARIIEYNRLTLVVLGDKYTFLLPDRDETHKISSACSFSLRKNNTKSGTAYELIIK